MRSASTQTREARMKRAKPTQVPPEEGKQKNSRDIQRTLEKIRRAQKVDANKFPKPCEQITQPMLRPKVAGDEFCVVMVADRGYSPPIP